MVYKIPKKSFFLAQDAVCIAKEFQTNLVALQDLQTDENYYKLLCSIDLTSYLSCVPNLAEAILKKSEGDLTIKIDLILKKIKNWQDSDNKNNLSQSIARLFQSILQVQSLKLEMTQKKMQEYINNQPYEKVSILETITYALKRISNPISIENALRSFKIYLHYQEFRKKSGENDYPEFLNRGAIKEERILKQWENLIFASFISIQHLCNNNSAYIRVIDILLFITQLDDTLRLEIIKQSGIRILLLKLKEDKNLTSDSARKTLTLLRDLCYKDSSAASLLGHHEIEENMLIVLRKFRGDREIENLVSQTLEQTIFGFDLDIQNFNENMMNAMQKLKEYAASPIDKEDLEKAQNNIQIIQFYSLMQVFTRKLISLQVHDLLYEIIRKELELKQEILNEHQVFLEHERILADSLVILKKVLLLPENASTDKNAKEDVPKKLVNNLLPNLILIIKWKTDMKEVIVNSLDCLKIFTNNENTKQGSIKLAVQSNIQEQLTILKDIYKDDYKMVKTINNLYFLFAKVVGEFANSLQKTSMVSNLVKLFQSKQAQNKTEVKRNLEYLNNLAEIPSTAKTIIEQGGIKFIQNYLKEENKDTKKTFLAESEGIEEHVYNLADGNDDQDEEEEIHAENREEELRKEESQLETYNTQAGSKEPSNPVEILRKLIQNHTEELQKFINQEIILEVLKYLRLQAQNKDAVFATLRVLQSCAEEEKTLMILNENKALESIFIALNQHPTDNDICSLSGLILGKLGADQIADEVKSQYKEMGDTFNPKDEDMIESIRQANIYLGNLLTYTPEDESDEIIEKNKSVIQALDKIMVKGLPSNFMVSLLLLIMRLCNQGEQTKQMLRESGIPKKIIDFMFEESRNSESGRLVEFCMEDLYSMIGGSSSENLLNCLDSQDGQEIEIETDEIKKEYLQPIDKLLNSQKVLEVIVQQLTFLPRETFNTSKQTQAKIYSRILRSQQLLARLIECDHETFAQQIYQLIGEEKIISLWNNLIQEDRSIPIKSTAFFNLGRLVSNLAKYNQTFFLKFSSQNQMNYVVETLLNAKINQDFINNLHEQITLKNTLQFIERFLNNQFDKTRLVDANIPSTSFKIFQRLTSLSQEDFESSGLICLLLKQTSEIIELQIEDSILAYDLSKYNLISSIINFLSKFATENTSQYQREDDPQNTEDIVASEGLVERAIESCYKLLNTTLNQNKFSTYASKIYTENSPIALVSCQYKISAYALTKTLQILYGLIVCYDNTTALMFNEPFEEISSNTKFSKDIKLAQTVVKQYPKIPVLTMLLKDLNQVQSLLLSGDLKGLQKIKDHIYGNLFIEEKIEEQMKGIVEKVEQYAEQIKQEEVKKNEQKEIMFEDIKNDDLWEQNLANPDTDIIKILDKISIALEKFSMDVANNNYVVSKDQENLIIKLLQTIRSITIDDNTALKVHKMGITDNLLNLLIVVESFFDDSFAYHIGNTLSHLTKFIKALKKVENEIDFIESIKIFLSFILEENSKNPSIQTIQRYKKTALEILETLKNITAVESQIRQFVTNKGVDQCIYLFEKSLDIIEILIKVVDILDKLAYCNKDALESCAKKITPYINVYCEKHSKNVDSMLGFALLGGTLCRNENSQNLLGSDKFHLTIINGLSRFPNNKILATNSFYALSGLAYNNKANCAEIMKTDILNIIKEQIKEFMVEHQVIETICSLLSNLTFKNEDVKRKLGEVGIVDLLGKIFSYYANQRVLSSKTTKQVLRAIGNSSLTIENATRIVKSNFVGLSTIIIEKMKYEEEGDVLRYCIDVIGNLSSHQDSINNENTQQMFKDGALDLILKVIKKNELNTDIISSCIDAIDGLVQNKLISVVAAENDAVSVIMKIIKSQIWNENTVLKGTRVLANISNTKQNIDQFLKIEMPLFIGSVLKNLDKPNDKIINYCFRILNRIASEKAKDKQLLQSGLIEALGEGLSHSQINPDCIFNYISLLKSIAKIPDAVQIIGEKSIANAILRANENKGNNEILGISIVLIERVLKCKAAVNNIVESGGFEILIHVIKLQKTVDVQLCIAALNCMNIIIAMDEKFRQQAQSFEQELNQLRSKAKDSKIAQHIDQCIFAILNKKESAEISKELRASIIENQKLTQEQKEFLVQGVNVRLYRAEGSFKNAVVCLDNDLKIVYAYKRGGEQKPKYKFALSEVTDYKFNYIEKNKVWELSTFSRAGGLFIKKPIPAQCCSIYGPSYNNERKMICFETTDVATKIKFQQAFLIALDIAKAQADSTYKEN
ncbi:hypothetical protein TTHERM_00537400 (macronuclear) [Tetrahymena thermophila SB210]|uniref:Uncharacterized protein n=1 Tax=Tetrahymena thermophila (strain SB210) TaxID=312017 RepID=I7M3K4_TETTS|nr:hypothetical protein TTHERM_00537400 [Tetrahymena thermophila SB210]EAS03305.2 hypothetical protein TTHERM_00537400 [Tetrahymena thermophila SB210]|eukprot:XP_001023550.2 hypothetical protein TTHERM_00537400 [Tetrahymena thermophila SB210]